MKSATITRVLATILLGGALLAHPAKADVTEQIWLAELTDQAAQAEGCDVAFFQRAREYTLAGTTVQEARISCLDRRQFDARRELPDVQFTFEDCTPVVC